MTVAAPALRYHGAKFRLAPWVISHFPPHRCYVESFGGAAGVLLRKPRSYAEVYNDLDGDVVNFFRVVRDPESCERLIAALHATPYARAEYELAYQRADDTVEPLERARRIAVRAGMGFGSSAAAKRTCGFRIDTQRRYSTAQHVWAKYPPGLRDVCERFSGVLVENRPAISVMLQHDQPDTLHYVDPPYLHETRALKVNANKGAMYRHEMTDADHAHLLAALQSLKGMVVLSGYPSPLYDETLKGWQRVDTESRIAAQRGTAIRTECLWMNPACADARTQQEAA